MALSSITTLQDLLPLFHARVIKAFNLQESTVANTTIPLQIFLHNPHKPH